MRELKTILKRYTIPRRVFIELRRLSVIFTLYKYRILAKRSNKIIVHFLHINKTGGTSIKYALKNKQQPYVTNKYIIFTHPHYININQIHKGEKFFFFVRDPIERYVSGFYCRKRKGKPKYSCPWTKGEEITFNTYSTPNQLAESLSDLNSREKAIHSLKTTEHIKSSYWDWFKNRKKLLGRKNDILFVGTIENLALNFEKLKQRLDLPKDLELPKSNVEKHSSTSCENKTLSEEAITNLRCWYREDYQFIKLIKEETPFL